ncbi:MAG: response regulator transcription factor [Burkholderiales bacterium]
MTRPTVLIAEDHRVVAEGLRGTLARDFDVVGIVHDGAALIEAAKSLRPDVIVADISMPRVNGIEALTMLREGSVDAPVVFLTMHREVAYARRALKAGASGYVLKLDAPEELTQAVRAALAGDTFVSPAIAGELLQPARKRTAALDPVARLTPRQRDILRLLAKGMSAKEIGNLLDISSRTVEFHKYQLVEVLDMKSSSELIHFAIRHGIADP